MFAVAQDGDGVAEIEHLAQAVADIEDRMPARLERFEHIENACDFRISQGCGRLIENEDSRVARQEPCNLDQLLLADAERAHGGIKVPLTRAQYFEGGARATTQVTAAMKQPNVGTSKPDIVEHGEPRGQAEFLATSPRPKACACWGERMVWAHHRSRSSRRRGVIKCPSAI